MNWERLVMHGLLGFFTAYSALAFAGFNNEWLIALHAALVQGALVAVLEWKKEIEGGTPLSKINGWLL